MWLVIIIVGGIILWAVFFRKDSAEPPVQSDEMTFSLRLNEAWVGDTGSKFRVFHVEARGLFPISHPVQGCFVISLMDVTNGSPQPVLSVVDDFQEQSTTAFQCTKEFGLLQPGYGLVRWCQVGAVIPEILRTAYSGNRNLRVIVRLVDSANPTTIELGAASGAPALYTRTLELNHQFSVVGYIEKTDLEDKATILMARLAVGMAMGDGELHKAEGDLIRAWAKKRIASIRDKERAEKVKTDVNEAMREAFAQSVMTQSQLSHLALELRKTKNKSIAYEAAELCFDILSADGKAQSKELEMINFIAAQLEIDPDEFSRIRDKRLLQIDSTNSEATPDAEQLLGIDPAWSREQKLAHLRKEFAKWNSRLNTVSEGPERASTQRMLDLIADLRGKLR
jgi:uncharacterized tellurite resistance protein B-like protein